MIRFGSGSGGPRLIGAPWPVLLYTALVAVLCISWGCVADPGGDHVENRPPDVWLASAPPSGTETGYKIHLYWGGWDPDGDIAYYEFVITDNDHGIFDPADTTTSPDGVSPWRRVHANDSLFTFTADEIVDTLNVKAVTRFERSHTFLIRSVDREGAASIEAAHRSFTAWNLSPSITITVPQQQGLMPLTVAPITSYQWRSTDYVHSLSEPQNPDSVRWILRSVENGDFEGQFDYIREHPNSPDWWPWYNYNAPGDSGQFWTTPPTDIGDYVFAVQAKDEAGAVTPVFDESQNMRRIRVRQRNYGPLLSVSNEYIGTVRTSVVNGPVVIVDLPAGLPLSFGFSANADQYGGLVAGYRYGWDINNLDDPDQWEIDYTPFTTHRGTPTARTTERVFFFGTHTFDIEVIDNTGAKARIEFKVNIIQFSMERSVLMVDDSDPDSPGIIASGGLVPNDTEHDAFWEQMLEDVVGFSPQDDMIEVRANQRLSITRIASYKSIIWDAWGGYNVRPDFQPKLYDLTQFRSKNAVWDGASKVEPNLLLLFLRAGGHLMLCGYQPLTQALPLNRLPTLKYPVILRYELGGDQDGNYVDQIQTGDFVGDESFGYREACIEVLDLAYVNAESHQRPTSLGCTVRGKRGNNGRLDGLREALPLDPRFPRMELRNEVASPTKAYAPEIRGLPTELYNPAYFAFCEFSGLDRQRPCFEPIYGNGCLDESSSLYNAPVAAWSAAYATVVPDNEDGVAARSVFVGFEPFYFKPVQVKEMLNVILFDEWQLRQF